MRFNEVNIEVKHSGLLEVPAGKEVDQLPQSHFQKLIDKKGYEAVIRGLTNLEVWNKNKNPKLSQWASNMADRLKVANKKDESYSQKNKSYTIHNVESLEKAKEIIRRKLNPKNLRIAKTQGLFYDGDRNIAQYGEGSRQLVIFESYSAKLYEASVKLAKKISDKAIPFLKNAGDKSKEALKRAGVTAQNAIVAGAAAPVGAKIANSYNKPKKKEQKYSASDVAAIAAALKKSESFSQKLISYLNLLEKKETKHEESGLKKVVKGAAKGAGLGLATGTAGGALVGHAIGNALTGGLKGKVAGGLVGAAAKGVRALTTGIGATGGAALGVTRGATGGALVAGGKHLYDKHKASQKNEALIEALDRLKSLYEESDPSKPRKKRILTPEQKARRQERRRLRRQLEKQGLYQRKPRSGPVKTIQGVQKLDTKAIADAQKTYANNVANPKPTNTDKVVLKNVDKPKATQQAKPQSTNTTQAKPQSTNTTQAKPQAKPQPTNTTQANSKTINKLDKAIKSTSKTNKVNNIFKKPQTYRKIVKKAGLIGGLKGAAITAGLGAAGLAAKKMYDKNKKK